MSEAATDFDQATLDPAAIFHAPTDVLRAPDLSPEQKKTILSRWEEDVEALIRATEEGMPPSDSRRSPGELLRAVHEAMQSLDRDAPAEHSCCSEEPAPTRKSCCCS